MGDAEPKPPGDIVEEVKDKVDVEAAKAKALRDKWVALSEQAQELVVSNQGLRRVVGALVASRQLYALALHDLDFRLESDAKPYSDIPPEDRLPLKEIFISSASKQASYPFEERDLLAGFEDTVIPWMGEVSSKHNEEQERRSSQEHRDAEADRRERNVSLGLGLMPEDEDELDRERSLVLVGWSPAVKWVVNEILDHALDKLLNFNQAVHLASVPRKIPDHRLLEVGGNAWENCAKSNASWDKLFASQYLEKLNGPVDLFVVSDLGKANLGYSFQSAASRAGEAQKRFRTWATRMGAAMIGVIPFEQPIKGDSLNTPEYEILRMFTRLRYVDAEAREDGNYDIIIGRSGRIENVSKEEVDAYATSDIIKP
jgi:hypothetical protein